MGGSGRGEEAREVKKPRNGRVFVQWHGLSEPGKGSIEGRSPRHSDADRVAQEIDSHGERGLDQMCRRYLGAE